jgi:hypothetical protein
MSRKFHLPTKFKKIPNTKELIAWYEDKLGIMENRQDKLSNIISNFVKDLKGKQSV